MESILILTWLSIIIIIAVTIIMLTSMKIIQPYEKGLLFIQNRFSRVINPGFNILPPLISKVVKIDLRTQTLELPKQDYITNDRKRFSAKITVYYKVHFPEMVYLNKSNYHDEVQNISQKIVQNKIRKINYNDIIVNKDPKVKLEYYK